MAKSRKKIFPKKPQPLSYLNEHTLNKNSHKNYEAYYKAMWGKPDPILVKPELTELQKRMLERLRKHAAQALNQKQD